MIRVQIQAGSRYPVSRQRIRQAVKETLEQQGMTSDIEVGVEIVGDRKMAQLHQAFLGKTGTTDVLSFPLAEAGRETKEEEREFVEAPDQILRLGDVVVAYPQARRQAQEHNLLVDEEIDRLIEHGVKHLLGMHHK
jgi:probable rRNA maturation factor